MQDVAKYGKPVMTAESEPSSETCILKLSPVIEGEGQSQVQPEDLVPTGSTERLKAPKER